MTEVDPKSQALPSCIHVEMSREQMDELSSPVPSPSLHWAIENLESSIPTQIEW